MVQNVHSEPEGKPTNGLLYCIGGFVDDEKRRTISGFQFRKKSEEPTRALNRSLLDVADVYTIAC